MVFPGYGGVWRVRQFDPERLPSRGTFGAIDVFPDTVTAVLFATLTPMEPPRMLLLAIPFAMVERDSAERSTMLPSIRQSVTEVPSADGLISIPLPPTAITLLLWICLLAWRCRLRCSSAPSRSLCGSRSRRW
jgi:hypothetical protein